MAGNFFRGTSIEQDGRWGKSDDKLIAKLTAAGKFSPILNQNVDISKVNIDVIQKWCTGKLEEILGFEDEILIGLIINLLQAKVRKYLVINYYYYFLLIK